MMTEGTGVALDSQAPMHARLAEMNTITPRVTELEETSLIYKGGNQDLETISNLSKVIQLVTEMKTKYRFPNIPV